MADDTLHGVWEEDGVCGGGDIDVKIDLWQKEVGCI